MHLNEFYVIVNNVTGSSASIFKTKRKGLVNKTEELRRKVLEKSSALFNEKGFDNVTLSNIIYEAGISETHFFRVFKQEKFKTGLGIKEGILVAIYHYIWKPFNQLTKEVVMDNKYNHCNARERITFLYQTILTELENLDELGTTFIMQIRKTGELGAQIVEAGMKEFAETIDQLIIQGQKEGTFRKDLNYMILRQQLIGCGENYLIGKVWQRRASYPADYTITDSMKSFQALLDGICVIDKKKTRLKNRQK